MLIGNEDNLRRRFNQRKPVVIANGAMEKSNDGVEYVYKSMRSFCGMAQIIIGYSSLYTVCC